MRIYDFEYDGWTLRDKGFIVCKFGSKGLETVSNGSNITFNTVSASRGERHELVSTEYGDCLSTTFQICKDTCNVDDKEISVSEMQDIMSWLNRKSFHKFRFINDEYIDIYFEGSFNVSKIEIDGRLCGFELNLITNRPFGLHNPIVVKIENTKANEVKKIYSSSDEEGHIYPSMEIVVNSNGNLEIYNEFENRTMRIANCKAGEVITVNYPMIESSLSSHKIQNDFNWIFFRLAKTYQNGLNNISISLPCTITMTYTPIVKVGL